jgi:hypothetical protein
MRMYSPSPTVHASPVPLYMRGGLLPHAGLGQDSSIDTGFADPGIAPDFGSPVFSSSPGIFAPSDPGLQPLIDQGFSADEADLIRSAASSGAISNAQFQDILSSKMSTTELENLILGAGTFASVAAAPRANRPPSSPSSSSAGSIVRSATDVAKAAAAGNQATLGPGASPRVSSAPSTGWTSGKTAFAGIVIPNIALAIGAGLFIFAAAKGGR